MPNTVIPTCFIYMVLCSFTLEYTSRTITTETSRVMHGNSDYGSILLKCTAVTRSHCAVEVVFLLS